MKTNRLFSLFACLLFSAVMMAEVVYEPLVVDSGFNRDVIKSTISGDTAISALYYSGTTSCFGTQSYIAQCNASFTDTAKFNRTVRSGWPDDYRDTIRCNTEWGADALNYSPYNDPKLFWLLAPYTAKNALCIRPTKKGDENLADNDEYKGFQGEGTLKFKKIGCYDRLFFLLVSLRKGGVADRVVKTKIYYTDASVDSTTFTLTGGLSGEARHKARMTNIYETTFKKNLIEGKEAAYAMVFDIEVDKTKLIDHISFSNPVTNSSVTILAVTGRTADVKAPKQEEAEVSNIEEHSFRACWNYIAEAASYRLDVAEDIDFQHLVEGYNNLNVGNTTCQEVAGLLADNDYYWRVRSVNADGGQSASSVPMRVKTAGGDIPETNEESEDIAEQLDQLLNTAVPEIDIHRTLYKDGYFNTICLPFNLTETQLGQSDCPLVGGEVYEFTEATQLSTTQLDIHVQQVSEIRAGYPYLIRWDNTNEVIPSPLVFKNVYISDNEGKRVGEGIQFVGHVGRVLLDYEDTHNLFLGEQNTLYWPINDGTTMRGFRAHFAVPTSGKAAVPRGTAARIVEQEEVATDFDVVVHDDTAITRKRLVNGQLVIEYNGRCYNVLGVEL